MVIGKSYVCGIVNAELSGFKNERQGEYIQLYFL